MASLRLFCDEVSSQNRHTDYSFELSAGAEFVLAAHGYQCMIVTGKHLDEPASQAHNLIYQVIHPDLFAGALLPTFTLENSSSPTRLAKLLAPRAGLAIVSIGAKLPHYSSIVADQEAGMSLLKNHLLAQAHYQRFLFVRGLPTHSEANHSLSLLSAIYGNVSATNTRLAPNGRSPLDTSLPTQH